MSRRTAACRAHPCSSAVVSWGAGGGRDTFKDHMTTIYGHTHFFGLHHLEDSSKFRLLACVDDDTLLFVVVVCCCCFQSSVMRHCQNGYSYTHLSMTPAHKGAHVRNIVKMGGAGRTGRLRLCVFVRGCGLPCEAGLIHLKVNYLGNKRTCS